MLGSHSATMPLVNVFLRNESGSHSKKRSQNITSRWFISWPFTFYPQTLEVTIPTFDFGSLFSPSPKKKVTKIAENCPKLRSLNSFWVLNLPPKDLMDRFTSMKTNGLKNHLKITPVDIGTSSEPNLRFKGCHVRFFGGTMIYDFVCVSKNVETHSAIWESVVLKSCEPLFEYISY